MDDTYPWLSFQDKVARLWMTLFHGYLFRIRWLGCGWLLSMLSIQDKVARLWTTLIHGYLFRIRSRMLERGYYPVNPADYPNGFRLELTPVQSNAGKSHPFRFHAVGDLFHTKIDMSIPYSSSLKGPVAWDFRTLICSWIDASRP